MVTVATLEPRSVSICAVNKAESSSVWASCSFFVASVQINQHKYSCRWQHTNVVSAFFITISLVCRKTLRWKALERQHLKKYQIYILMRFEIFFSLCNLVWFCVLYFSFFQRGTSTICYVVPEALCCRFHFSSEYVKNSKNIVGERVACDWIERLNRMHASHSNNFMWKYIDR